MNWDDIVDPRALEIEFVAAANEPVRFPRLGLPEVALIGRSNVGKSSFLNALAGGRAVARTSRTPGRTRSVNFYRGRGLALVDLPGYGFARVSKEERKRWQSVIEAYLTRDEVRLAVVLVDARHAPSESDQTMLEWLRHHQLETRVLLAKADKIPKSAVIRAVADAARALDLPVGHVVALSAFTGLGVKEARRLIESIIVAGIRDTAAGGTVDRDSL